jgi:hypothetical protein
MDIFTRQLRREFRGGSLPKLAIYGLDSLLALVQRTVSIIAFTRLLW